MSLLGMVPARHHLPSVTAGHAIDDKRRPGERWGWTALRRTLALWRHRARARAELRLVPDHLLKDLPFDTEMLLSERSKPFWKE